MINATSDTTQAPKPTTRGSHTSRIVLAHGGGGQLTDEQLSETVLPRLGMDVLDRLDDAALLPGRIATTIDSYVVQPWRFPGGDIGRLSVCGTVNDLAVCGAQPIGISLSLIMAEGFSRLHLEQILDSIRTAADEASVSVVTGDTKVIGAENGDGIYITTAGVGRISNQYHGSARHVKPGDVLIINGSIGEHGLTVMLTREMPEVQTVLTTDAAPLNHMISRLLKVVPDVRFMRDPTRSGLSGVAVDLAKSCGWHVVLEESMIPVKPEAQHAADMLGLDPLEIANEGKVVIVVDPDDVSKTLDLLHQEDYGREATVIGEIQAIADGMCELHTNIGGHRIVQKPYGEQLPRIC